MNSDDITPEHSRRLAVWLVPALLKLGKLRDRMKETGFPSDDVLYQAVATAHESIRTLRAKLHTIEMYRDPVQSEKFRSPRITIEAESGKS